MNFLHLVVAKEFYNKIQLKKISGLYVLWRHYLSHVRIRIVDYDCNE